MPKFLEKKLKAEYPNNPRAVYATMNSLGYMHGNKETAKGKAAQAKHERNEAKGHPNRHKNLGTYLHPKKGK